MTPHDRAQALLSLASLPPGGQRSLIAEVRSVVSTYRLLSHAQVPRRHLADLYDGTLVECQARDELGLGADDGFWAQAGGLVVLEGGLGLGKSLAAAQALAMRAPDRRLGPPRWVACEYLATMSFAGLQQLAGIAGAPIDDGERRRTEATTCRTMVLDDAGAPGSDSGKAREVTAAILAARASSGWWTVVTTNLGAEDFGLLYGARIVDRLREAGRWATLTGASLRRPAQPLPTAPVRVVRADEAIAAYEQLEQAVTTGTPPEEAHMAKLERSLARYLRLGPVELSRALVRDREQAAEQRQAFAAAAEKLEESTCARAARERQAERERQEHARQLEEHAAKLAQLRQRRDPGMG